MAAHKLQGRMDFQGLPVSIENRKGSYRHWKDHFNGTEGKTLMKYAYGYVRGTLGTDGDEVDVYVGPNEKADQVFVITQMKTPEFKEVDEQKCMLGFDSAKEAKKAYIDHYDNPKFFGSMKAMSLDEFKAKLKSKGKLIKCAKLWYNITLETDTMTKLRLDPRAKLRTTEEALVRKGAYALDDEDMDLKKKKKEKKDEVEKSFAAFHAAMDQVEKAMTARSAAALMGTNGRVTTHNKLVADLNAVAVAAGETPAEPAKPIMEVSPIVDYGVPGVAAGIAREQPLIGNAQEQNPFEPPKVPVRRVETPAPSDVSKGIEFSTGVCGHIVKSADGCETCTSLYQGISPGPYWG